MTYDFSQPLGPVYATAGITIVPPLSTPPRLRPHLSKTKTKEHFKKMK